MSITERSEERVKNVLARLEGQHGRFVTVSQVWQLTPDQHQTATDRFEGGAVGGAGVWVHDDAGAVLLVREADDEGWSEASGAHRPDEPLEETAQRGVKEQTGVVCRLTGVELARVVTARAPDRPPLTRLFVVFAGQYMGDPLEPAADIEAKWWDSEPPQLADEALDRLPIPVTDRR